LVRARIGGPAGIRNPLRTPAANAVRPPGRHGAGRRSRGRPVREPRRHDPHRPETGRHPAARGHDHRACRAGVCHVVRLPLRRVLRRAVRRPHPRVARRLQHAALERRVRRVPVLHPGSGPRVGGGRRCRDRAEAGAGLDARLAGVVPPLRSRRCRDPRRGRPSRHPRRGPAAAWAPIAASGPAAGAVRGAAKTVPRRATRRATRRAMPRGRGDRVPT
jgi:hypothetical protein